MPIDPRIPLAIQSSHAPSPEALTGLLFAPMQLRAEQQKQQAAAQAQQQKDAEETAWTQAVQASVDPATGVVDLDRALAAVTGRVSASTLLGLQAQVLKQREAMATTADKELTTRGKQIDEMLKILDAAASGPTGWDMAYGAAAKVLPPPVMANIPRAWHEQGTPAMVDAIRQSFLDEKTKTEIQQKAAADLRAAMQAGLDAPKQIEAAQRAMAQALATVDDPAPILAYAKAQGVPDAVIAGFAGKSKNELAAMTLTPKEQQDLTLRQTDDARQAATLAETMRHNRVMEQRPDASGGASGLSPTAESNIINRLTTQWTTAVKPTRELERQAMLMEAGLKASERGDKAAGAQAVLVTFQKILDPTSVVRESEYARSSAGLALLDRIQGSYERLVSGGAGVPTAELQKFAQLARDFVRGSLGDLAAIKERIGKTADHFQIPRTLVFEDTDPVSRAAGHAGGESPTGQSPTVGETRTVNGVTAVWDGFGWKPKGGL